MEEKETRQIKHEFGEAEREMYNRTKTGSILVYLIVAASVVVFVVTGRGAVAVQLSMCVLVMGVMQSLWQGFALELFIKDLERKDQKEFHKFPDHIGTGGWVFYVLKMMVAIMAAVELILSV